MTAVACYGYDAPVTRKNTSEMLGAAWGAMAFLALSGSALSGTNPSVNVQTPQVRKSIQVNSALEKPTSIGQVVFNFDALIADDEMSPQEVLELGKSFGFSNTKWAEIFGVSRDLVQKWAANATVRLQQKNVERATTFKDLKNYMKQEHVPYLAKLTQGFLEVEELSEALRDKSSTSEELTALYDKYYSKFDGAYKRSLIG